MSQIGHVVFNVDMDYLEDSKKRIQAILKGAGLTNTTTEIITRGLDEVVVTFSSEDVVAGVTEAKQAMDYFDGKYSYSDFNMTDEQITAWGRARLARLVEAAKTKPTEKNQRLYFFLEHTIDIRQDIPADLFCTANWMAIENEYKSQL